MELPKKEPKYHQWNKPILLQTPLNGHFGPSLFKSLRLQGQSGERRGVGLFYNSASKPYGTGFYLPSCLFGGGLARYQNVYCLPETVNKIVFPPFLTPLTNRPFCYN